MGEEIPDPELDLLFPAEKVKTGDEKFAEARDDRGNGGALYPHGGDSEPSENEDPVKDKIAG